ncbi:Rv1535 domain-containing protein [Mycobacterium sp. 852002-51971_SCH5477799-a]|uniref:Rv1535 domain-containing protein n=1 Tax=Mycobacterium sp. 852002-51971_SCH5477799-a TaxID=1834106 RepID=UPI001E5B6E4E|nr:Rv1535 domain-containing protein [Mycobacterium sp. 852002-51971_SCH5477799-a]
MSTMTGTGGDPLVTSFASVLRVPLIELYALLWRVGVVEIRHNDQVPRRGATGPSRVVRGPTCPDPSAHSDERVVRLPLPQLASAMYSRATG